MNILPLHGEFTIQPKKITPVETGVFLTLYLTKKNKKEKIVLDFKNTPSWPIKLQFAGSI